MKLIIRHSSWSGWSKENNPEEMESEYEVKLNEKYVIKTTNVSSKQENEWVKEEWEILSFYVTEVTENSIKINTSKAFSDNDNGTINLFSNKKEFIITTEKPVRLVTPTMDYGDIFIFTLVK